MLVKQTVNFDRDIIMMTLNKLPALEVKEAIKSMKKTKVCGLDRIPTELFKYGGDFPQHQLHQLIWKSDKY